MIILIACLCLLFEDSIKDKTTAEDVCKAAYNHRLALIAECEKQLIDLQKNNDWDKLSDQAKSKLEKPIRERLKKITTNRQPSWPEVKSPEFHKPGEVYQFKLAHPKHPANYAWTAERALDDHSVVANGPSGDRAKGESTIRIVIEGLKKEELPKKANTEIAITGLWLQIEDITLNKQECRRIIRCPYEAEARKMWPEYLKKREAEAAEESSK